MNTMDNFNEMIEQARERNACDSKCQFRKKADELKKQYLQSEENVQTAPEKAEEAKREYYTFIDGDSGYKNELKKEYQQKAELITDEYTEIFNKEKKNISSNLIAYSSNYNSVQNLIELYLKLEKENRGLKKNLKSNSSSILTNERKSYYEDEGLNLLKLYYKILIGIYILTIFAYLIGIIGFKSDLDYTKKIVFFIILIILPFISSYALAYIIDVIYTVYYNLPKNVHLHLV
jgi:hypothetical protein